MRASRRGFRQVVSTAAAGLLVWGALGVAAAEQKAAGAHADSAHDSHSGAQSHGGGEHGGGHGEHHQEFNWVHGIFGEKEGVEPSLFWRAPGTPPPFAATLFNSLLLIGLLVRFAKQPVARGLAERRQKLLRGMEDAAAMQAEATEQLRVYRSKLDNLDAEIERVKREMRESAEIERRRVLEEATARRGRLEQEARVLLERELEALREQLTHETAVAALESARELLKRSVSTDDHRRLCEEYLQALAPGAVGLEAGSPVPAVEPPRVSEPTRALPGRSEIS